MSPESSPADRSPERPAAGFPVTRLRRLRYDSRIRSLVRETRLTPENLILPLFVRRGQGVRQEIASMPGHYQLSLDMLADEAERLAGLGLGGVILFGIPEQKDAVGSDACSDEGIVQDAVRTAKQSAPSLLTDHRRLLLRIHRPWPLRRG